VSADPRHATAKLPNGRLIRRPFLVAEPRRPPWQSWIREAEGWACGAFILGIVLVLAWEILPAFFDGRVAAVIGGK
jgi:hypothetical protein